MNISTRTARLAALAGSAAFVVSALGVTAASARAAQVS
jgi:hypothetical protein